MQRRHSVPTPTLIQIETDYSSEAHQFRHTYVQGFNPIVST